MDRTGIGALKLAVLFLIFVVSRAAAQQMDYRILDNAASDIKMRKMVSEETLARDRAVINAAAPSIKAEFTRKGFAETDANAAIVSGWKDFRLTPAPIVFNEDTFRVYVNKLGKLRIESEPTAAEIEIDAIRLDTKTNTTKWLQPGTYRVVLTKDGYMPEEARIPVAEGSNPILKRTLKRRPK